MAVAGGLGVVHKNITVNEQVHIVEQIKSQDSSFAVGCAVGIGQQGWQRADILVAAGVDALVIDTAHGHSRCVLDTALYLKKNYPEVTLIVGNIVSREAALCLAEIGVDAVKVGIGPGSICTTRIVSGVGMPQLTAIMDVVEALHGSSVRIIAAGAHCVMLGSMLAGTDEAPGDIVHVHGQAYKMYRGMGSQGAMEKGSAERYFQERSAKKFVPEGVEGLVPYKGSLDDVLYQILGGLRSGMGYLGARNLEELQKKR
ncbi:Inosine-5'-monophosphate dehydrogenase [Chlamydia abortus]|nr:Inosine-5'-monophosphate dehydrogenase [Chlamydia abortus]